MHGFIAKACWVRVISVRLNKAKRKTNVQNEVKFVESKCGKAQNEII